MAKKMSRNTREMAHLASPTAPHYPYKCGSSLVKYSISHFTFRHNIIIFPIQKFTAFAFFPDSLAAVASQRRKNGGLMEVAGDGKRSLSREVSPSSSFRLRSPTLNSLRFHRIFDVFDKNGDGVITVEDLNETLSLLGMEMDLSDLDLTVKSFVKSGDIGLTFDDFVELHQSLDETIFGFDSEEEAVTQSTLESDLTEAFKVFDENGDGFISAQELQMVLGKLGLPEGKEISEVEQMISSVDINKDGRVDFIEFKNMMQSVLVPSS